MEATAVQNGNSPRILIVGSDDNSARSMAGVLRQGGYRKTTLIVEGKRAVLTALREHYDLAVVETCLCGMDGYEVAERLINLPGKPEGIPVILVSADSSEVPLIQATILNASGVVIWPFESEDLPRKVEEAMGRTVALR